ncbi:MAG: hypothetical protein ACTSU3_06500 [Candidatus Thorarchaeota archaeon]
MQYLLEMQHLLSIFAGVSSVFIASFLLYTWTKYENRLLTDLPLIMGITSLFLAMNMIVVNAISVGYIPDTMEVFRWRSVLIGGMVLPLLELLLIIWAPRRRKYHPHAIVSFGIWWLTVSLLGPSREIIMLLCIPFVLMSIIGMGITFTITWKTKRLTEIRSGFIVIGAVFMFISQVSKVWLMSFGLSYISDLFIALGILAIAIAIINPQTKKERKEEAQIPTPTLE